jgi:hypothetical protein
MRPVSVDIYLPWREEKEKNSNYKQTRPTV